MRKKNIYKHPINEYIKAPMVRVIYGDINQIMSLENALSLAEANSMDLVQFGAGPSPTCRIIDYSKYRYHEEKKKKAQEQNNKVKLKEVQLRPSIDIEDRKTKTNQMKSFLEEGSEVKIRLKLRGREKANPKEHFMFLVNFANSFMNSLEEPGKVDMKISQNSLNPAGGIVSLKPIKLATKTSSAGESRQLPPDALNNNDKN